MSNAAAYAEQAHRRLSSIPYESLGPAGRCLVSPPPLPAAALEAGIGEMSARNGDPASGPCKGRTADRAGWQHAWQQRRHRDDPQRHFALCVQCGAVVDDAAVTLIAING